MADRSRPGAAPHGVLRPALAVASLVPLAVAGTALALSEPHEPVPVQHQEVTAQEGARTAVCPGALQLPEDLAERTSDDDLGLVPPAEAVAVRTISLEPASSLLFGSVNPSTTLQEDDGSVRHPTIWTLDADGEVLGDDAEATDLGLAAQRQEKVTGPSRVVTAASQGGRPVADSVQSVITPSGDYRSLVVTRCSEATTSAGFLGVSTQRGDSSELVLRNDTDRPATASVQLWTAEGPAKMEGRSQVVVPAHSQERVLLGSVVADEPALGVRVDVVGSPLAMSVQATERDGLTPGGAEILTPLPDPASDLVIPGVDVAEAEPTVVIANPSGEATTATITVLGPDGPIEDATVEDLPLAPGSVITRPLPDLDEGTYAVAISAADPVQAVARAERTGKDLPGDTLGKPVDFTLTSPAPALVSHGITALPATTGPGALSLAATEEAVATVIPLGADGGAGKPIEVELDAGRTATLPAARLGVDGKPAAGISVVPDVPGAVHASWVQRAEDSDDGVLLSTLPVVPARGGTDAVTVRLSE
ncbi:DUF5719 family protein [Brachybacterium sp. UMB0905]|uniref:DUF5719 family protein n=1 Tax=Brachybacterium sp. UMB0905 TaxID=2069310 RepID=UPI000C80BE64|nr:DUF5719 family protein [Brachybacterium sp. UMB0905]PMC76529.1 hypothetical protein CJ197_01875 [Brachybacterium sp. UMB0905]